MQSLSIRLQRQSRFEGPQGPGPRPVPICLQKLRISHTEAGQDVGAREGQARQHGLRLLLRVLLLDRGTWAHGHPPGPGSRGGVQQGAAAEALQVQVLRLPEHQ